MQAILLILCAQCNQALDMVSMDTADMPEELQAKVNRVILAHRESCRYYSIAVKGDIER
ncbi:hypothetical protein ES705_18390 [subsurface metagenome]